MCKTSLSLFKMWLYSEIQIWKRDACYDCSKRPQSRTTNKHCAIKAFYYIFMIFINVSCYAWMLYILYNVFVLNCKNTSQVLVWVLKTASPTVLYLCMVGLALFEFVMICESKWTQLSTNPDGLLHNFMWNVFVVEVSQRHT